MTCAPTSAFITPAHETKMPLHTYYFHETHETVVARNAMLAAAFYASHHQIHQYAYVSANAVEGDTVVASIEIHPMVIEICLEPTTPINVPEGTICEVHNGHAVPPGYFQFLMSEALFDTDYGGCEPPTDLYHDILEPLKDDFHKLTGDQLQRLAMAIVFRRQDHGDILPTLRHIINHHYGLFIEHMDDIIGQKCWDFQYELDELMLPSRHTGGCC